MLARSMFLVICVLIVVCSFSVRADEKDAPSIVEKTEGMKRFNGFLPFYWDGKNGKVWLEISRFDEEFLYLVSLPAGVGSNDIGLDRGQLGGTHVVSFFRSGPKVLLIEPNYRFRANTRNADEQKAVQDAFATSVLAGFTVEAEENGSVLVDATAFLLSDAHGVVGALDRAKQGQYSLNQSRSAFFLPMLKNFPLNTEIEALLTFTGKHPGGLVRSVAPTASAITVRERHSFVQLPNDRYVPRRFDPRGGFFGIRYADYAAPLGEPLEQRFIARHRLNKKNPLASMSEPVEPIVYYVDRGTPEPIRSALLEGARWWDEAFRAAGFLNAFRVDVLPPGADPLDIRYNVIQWVHRSTRGWSYGSSITDPRTGEIIKGHVSLGSLRARQDYLIAEGLLAPYDSGKPAPPDMRDMALARLRQLAAHEVGHTLGLSHNYIASTVDRASVMDYPHPYARLAKNGTIDLSDAYDSGIGEWDKVAISFGYREYPPEINSDSASESILLDAMRDGLFFLTDQDARPAGSAHPQTHLWDNGSNAADELDRIMVVRASALKNFSEKVIPEGRPMATLEEALVPLYLGHRYQVEAASKVIAGASYRYAHRGDGQPFYQIVSGQEQRRALDAVLHTLAPEELVLSERITSLIPPRPYGYGRHRELFSSRTLPLFDRVAPAEAAAEHTLSLLFAVERANRLVQNHAENDNLPGLEEVLDAILDRTWHRSLSEDTAGEVLIAIQSLTLDHMISLAVDSRGSAHTRAIVFSKTQALLSWIRKKMAGENRMGVRAHLQYSAHRIEHFLSNPGDVKPPVGPVIPPGQPIGS